MLLGTESLQTLGGSGFLQDYPIEQYVRDAKIDTLYEGTTAIQGLDFFFRKIVRDQGQALGHVATQIQEFAKAGERRRPLAKERELLGKALDDVQGILGYMVGELMKSDPRQEGGDVRNVYKVGQNTTPAAARRRRPGGRLAAAAPGRGRARRAASGTPRARTSGFYEGKVAAAPFFARHVCPSSPRSARSPRRTDNSLMDLPEAAF